MLVVEKKLQLRTLAETIAEVIGFKGNIDFDTTKPDGSPRKILDSKLINNLGFQIKNKIKGWSYHNLSRIFKNLMKTLKKLLFLLSPNEQRSAFLLLF